MPTHKKGQDRDKYYQLAKDQGYRSRAAFKLIQINKRYDFLRNAKVCIDLCAAPGGWCQVAAKFMPAGSLVIGVDLLPIKAIRGVKTIVGDITTASCRKDIVAELQGWKADVVLCDGAPNIGAAYNKDAFVQNELVLAAMKTASEHLNKGGVFCTKVYRSVDYNALVWAVQQLFEDVQTMKPSSSRSQSSEIFLICSGFTAPKSIDAKLFDPNYVFKEVADPGLKGPDVLHKKFDQSNKRHRTGYDDALGITLHATNSVSEFIHSKDPVRLLTDTHEMKFTENCQQYKDHPKTTEEVKLAFTDLRVLGKIDFKKLLKWRQTMIDTFHPAEVKAPKVKNDSEQKPVDIEEEIERLKLEALEKKRKELKKDRKQASKERIRQNLGMNNNAFSVDDDTELFSLEKSKVNISDVNLSEDEDFAAAMQDDTEEEAERDDGKLIVLDDNMDDEMEEDYVNFLDKRRMKKRVRGDDGIEERTASAKRDAKQKSLDSKAKGAQDDDLQAFSDDEKEGKRGEDVRTRKLKSAVQGDLEQYLQLLVNKSKSKSKKDEEDDVESVDSSDEDEEEVVGDSDDDSNSGKKVPAVGKWFDNPLFSKLSAQPKSGRKSSAETKEDEIEKDLSMPLTDREKRQEKRRKAVEKQQRKAAAHGANLADDDEADEDKVVGGKRKASAISGSNDFEVVPVEDSSSLLPRVDSRHYDTDEEDYDAQDRITTLALGTYMLRNSRKKALIDASYNRYSWNDPTGLPSWFVDDEMRHNKPQLPVPQALVDQIKSKYQMTGTKVIKKVAEARLRKRKRAMQKLNAAKKQASVMAENSELSERQKIKAITKAIRNSKTEKSSKVYVATKKTQQGSIGNAGGGKGKLKFVDKRMKKDRRAMKAVDKKRRK